MAKGRRAEVGDGDGKREGERAVSSALGPEGRITVLIVLIRPAVYANLYRQRRTLYTAAVVYIICRYGSFIVRLDTSILYIYTLTFALYTTTPVGFFGGTKRIIIKKKTEETTGGGCTAVAVVHEFSFDTLSLRPSFFTTFVIRK